MNAPTRTAPLALVLALTAAACGGSEKPAPAPAPAPSPAPTAEGAPAAAWPSMTHEQREAHMKAVVMPAMRAAFAKWKPDEFADMKCGVCHGKEPKKRNFKMPNPDIEKLPTSPEGWKALEAHEPDAVAFMGKTVVPEMAKMLGVAPYDPATKQGFGCFNCHEAQK